jgi:uncharacterized protein
MKINQPDNKYHTRHPDKEIIDSSEILRTIKSQKFMTIAMSKGNEPYLVTVNYAFNARKSCFYFHCSKIGKKSDYIRSNPKVWGQILEDKGYLNGKCDHAYCSIQFSGLAEFIDNENEKRKALELLIEQLEPNPLPVKERFLKQKKLNRVGIVRIKVIQWSGKTNS